LIRGTVAKTYTRDWQGDDGEVILHSFQLQGDKRYFRTGTDQLVAQGDYITFDIEGNNNVVPHTLEKGKAQTAVAPKPASGGSYGRSSWGGGGKGSAATAKPKSDYENKQAYWDDKEKRDIDRERRQHEVIEPRITFSSSQRDAIDVVKMALDKDMLSFGNANKAAKYGMLLDYIDEVAARFYAQRINAAETVKGLGSSEPEAAAAEESDDE
jgi:hypothetical protein